MIRHWSRGRFIAFSAVVGVVAFFLSVWISDVARRRGNEVEMRRELVLSATTVRGNVAVYDSRADPALVGLDADVARLRRTQLVLMLGVGVVAVLWAGVARAWLVGRQGQRTPPSAPRSRV